MVRKATDMGFIRRRMRGFLFFCCIFIFVRSGLKALIGVRNRVLRRRSILTPSQSFYYANKDSDFERGFDNRAYPVYSYDNGENGYPQEFQVYGNQYMHAKTNDEPVIVNNPVLVSQVVPVKIPVAPVIPAFVPVAKEIPRMVPEILVRIPVEIPVEKPTIPRMAPSQGSLIPRLSAESIAQKLQFEPQTREPAGEDDFEIGNPAIARSTSEPSLTSDRFDWNYDEESDELLNDVELDHSIPNANFIFHNKLPKSGSTTMHDILRELSTKNLFYYKKMDSANMNFDDDNSLVDYIQENMKKPFFYMQHHFFTNFTKYGIDQPTMINVIREPIDWFSSHYHFKLYGWSRKPGQRGDQNEMTLEECVNSNAPTCTRNHWRYIEFFCGNGPECQTPTTAKSAEDEAAAKSRMVEAAKRRMLNDYFVIGVLEQFEDSLRVLEKLLPRYYRGALDVYQSKNIQTTRNQTKSLNKRVLPDGATYKLRTTTLKHEVDLYHFARQLFNQRMKHMNIERFHTDEEL